MKVIYIASPYTQGDIARNVKEQIDCADRLAELEFIPRWPLASHFWHMIHPHPWQFWMDLDLEEVTKCDALLRLPGDSKGADAEVQRAIERNIPVFYSIEELSSWIERIEIDEMNCIYCGLPIVDDELFYTDSQEKRYHLYSTVCIKRLISEMENDIKQTPFRLEKLIDHIIKMKIFCSDG